VPYASIGVAPSCQANDIVSCVVYVVLSPIFLIFGPLAHDAEDPTNPYPTILIAAAIVTMLWTGVANFRQRRRVRNS
jgi:hypothetical protein